MRGKRGNPGLKGRLLDKSIEAYVLALETVNRLSIQYRIETFAYLICNAWELLLKAKIIHDAGKRRAIYYKKKRGEPRRSLSLRDALRRVIPDENNPVRRNLDRIAELRDEAVHLVISQVPPEVISLFQACVINYHTQLGEWFEVSLSDFVPVGMMAITYDLSPEQLDLQNPRLKRHLGREAVQFLTAYQEALQQDEASLGGSAQFSIPINYSLALVSKPADADIVLTKGPGGSAATIVEVPKDPGRTHPLRRKEATQLLNQSLPADGHVTPYDVECVVEVHGVTKRPEFFYHCAVPGSPKQYSVQFVEWMLKQHAKDPSFFRRTRARKLELNAEVRAARQ